MPLGVQPTYVQKRINHQGYYRLLNASSWQPLAAIVTDKNPNWMGRITCFKKNPLECTLLAHWSEDYTDPWLIVTDLNPEQADICWYQLRSWLECSYRDLKSDGFDWHQTRLRQPDRAERHWLAMSVAMFWMVTLGGEQEISHEKSLINDRISTNLITSTPTLSCAECTVQRTARGHLALPHGFVNGLLTVVAQLLNGESLSLGRLFPLPLTHFNDLASANSS